MTLKLFHQHFPDVAKAETRFMILTAGPGQQVPDGRYAIIESYCADPTCDCRRVLLHIMKDPEGVVAVIGFGFDRDGPMPGPFLDPLNPQSEHAQELLEMVDRLCLRDPAYVARLERHYQMMKDKFGRPASRKPGRPPAPRKGPGGKGKKFGGPRRRGPGRAG
jgi:hypothetical protein